MKIKLNRETIARTILMILGNVFLALGIAIFKYSGMGNDPFSAMVMALSDVVGIAYANFLLMLNIVLFIVEFITGRKYIGLGTFFNAILIGYIVTFFYNIFISVFGEADGLILRIIIVVVGVIVVSFGVSLYQTSDQGVAPYDYLALGMTDKWSKIPYFWHRIACDGTCAFVAFLSGGIVGLGTLVSALGLGPVVNFFDVKVSRKLIAKFTN